MNRVTLGFALGAFLAAPALAAAQDPSDPIYNENTFANYRITMAAADWNAIVNDPFGSGDLWKRCSVQWQGDPALNDVGIKAVGTNRRAGNAKPSVRLKFDEFVPGREWRGIDDVKLEGSIIEGFNERVSYWTYRQFGVPAPRAAHAQIYVNGDLKGVYEVMESVRKKFVTYHLRISNPDGNLYKIDRRPNGDATWRGDHYLWRGSTASTYVPPIWEAITNEIGGNYSDVVGLLDILNNAPQAERRTRLDGAINLDKFYSYLAVLAATGDYDSVLSGDAPSTPNNHFWYHREDTNRLQAIPWDPSNTFGSTYWLDMTERINMNIWFGIDPAVTSSTQWDGRSRTNTKATAWMALDSVARNAYVSKLRQLIDGPFPNAVSQINFVNTQIRSAVLSDPYKGSGPSPLTNAQYDTRVQEARNWVPARISAIRSQLPATTSPPAAPSGLTATATSSSQINLSWTDTSANETGFEIDRAAASTGPWTQIATAGTNATTFPNTGLAASTTYFYRVRATNSAGDSANSNVASATTQAPPVVVPTAPSGLTATATSSTQINLSWTDTSANETGFEIDRAAASAGPWTLITTVGVNVRTYSNSDLAASTTYFYRVRATNSAGDSANSNVASATTQAPPAVAPTAPSGLTATATSSTQINLSWTDTSANETGFEIDRAAASAGPWTLITTVGVNVRTYSNSGLAASTTYFYRVRATNSAGDSANSNVASATTQAPPAVAPTAPSGLTATATSSSQINLSWTDTSANETGFEIDRASASTGPWTQIATAGANATTFPNTGLAASTTYFYRVRATNSAGDSANSNVASATTQAPPAVAPTAPSGLTATAVTPSEIQLSWVDTSTNETGFEIDRASASTGPWTQIATAGTNATTFPNTGLAASTTYFYRVRATNSAGDSANSNVASATTPNPGTVTSFQDGSAPAATYAGTRDTTLSQNDPTGNFGPAVSLRADGDDVAGSDLASLLRWDLSSIPSGSVVQSAAITLNVSNTSVNTYEVYELRRDWVESQATWNVTATGASWQTAGAQGGLDRGTTVLGTLAPTAPGSYVFTLNAAGVAVVQSWINTPGTNFGFVIANAASADGTAFDSREAGVPANRPKLTVIYTPGTPAGGGLSATYYDNEDFTGTSVTRTDPTVDFNWVAGSPAPAIGPDTFSSRWTGRVRPQYSETYTFYTFTNDGARLWVEGEFLVDRWVQQSGGVEWSGQVALEAGRWYTIQMDHYEGTGNAVARLSWSSPSTPKQGVPQSALDPALGAPDSRDNDGDGISNDTDLDDDNDGIPDLQDPDRDGDAVTNLAERASGTDPDDRDSPGGGGNTTPAVFVGDNPNGDAWINDRCAGGSIPAPGGGSGLGTFLLLSLPFLFRRRRTR